LVAEVHPLSLVFLVKRKMAVAAEVLAVILAVLEQDLLALLVKDMTEVQLLDPVTVAVEVLALPEQVEAQELVVLEQLALFQVHQ
jgi:hypothetical protein